MTDIHLLLFTLCVLGEHGRDENEESSPSRRIISLGRMLANNTRCITNRYVHFIKQYRKTDGKSIFECYCLEQLPVAEIIHPPRWARSCLGKAYNYNGQRARVVLLMCHLTCLFIGALIYIYIYIYIYYYYFLKKKRVAQPSP